MRVRLLVTTRKDPENLRPENKLLALQSLRSPTKRRYIYIYLVYIFDENCPLFGNAKFSCNMDMLEDTFDNVDRGCVYQR